MMAEVVRKYCKTKICYNQQAHVGTNLHESAVDVHHLVAVQLGAGVSSEAGGSPPEVEPGHHHKDQELKQFVC